ncbi:HK97-gp10 family putative phage morphogenesis protein [Salipiger sp. PrR003]|uniref:HK97-gp10 family putative phage morphogenesis protein n=1 Tax=Salipiger sp. PrR003 TaxID=2706776 RepID=UPI0013DD2A74|nr:HK97-gp10 family putative phage morphogenesis protein [Salipiger sp. PrR003]NDV52165.1 HK97 gp10 family phage protein [Salipiger sp. PrR003]NDV52191.1 HK97 gp10 family phage protein [Salipiger sp. PrR003]
MADDGGLSKFQARLRAIPAAAREAVTPALTAGGYEIADAIEALAPEDEGDLIGSIAVTLPGQSTPPYSQPGGGQVVPENQVAITAGNSDVRYPHLVEYGTTHTAAQPFFWPGYRLARKKAQNRIKRAISKAIRGAK